MRLLFAGTPEPAVPALRALLASEHEVVGVLTRPDARSGRGRGVRRSPVGQVADESGIPVLTPASLRDPEARSAIVDLAPDCCPVVAYGGMIPPDLLDVPRHGWINLHFSLLPAWRGAAPVQAALEAGDEVTGASTFRIEAGLDTGPVFGVLTERIRPDDTATVLLGRLAEYGAELLTRTVDGVAAGAVSAVPQSTDGVSHAPKVSVDGARVRFDLPAGAVDRHIRAMTDAPGAWAQHGDVRLKLGPVVVATDGAPLRPGELLVSKRDVLVGTATAPVRLGTVQPPGKKPMPAADWARGARIESGLVIGTEQ
ncbi:Methionyl-tRNA formyltransferase OS=Tsukamurella paurometabola (strain ATCC 8368 / DSM / CCUG 35730 / CIP 100753 / JCM 10117 / KCTC 9821 / NBRC 16120 /NCIMB 702349 / NCTC 13040) OX=521096 GN=fmt PE=3 SV=1 [Tsukamurella paurometabola]|uniref:Methionyl-tRNA formyltransferase n=1 Tax=Tsukamurella paurometabola (strain ATCC 8368 / DSM 20162 / CCUG 35730 / CIP 100753 / JCM 10117 / KCTC 9821 / NBRC 16120 / NCIMB 702349 / NCTC 13040) TaxID=521096 RepID=D5URW5_TSUPD|nr:methionyl-tRNA formyltransferase [Tsukamurella paurometabola]ADG79170.1 methionyl-tRNA formyltransferase [Tsukamurella paurometabola DSM 20162]SUP34379.1 Methionyl-tRNA formyltransferase [Tsukamurella paurometabola]